MTDRAHPLGPRPSAADQPGSDAGFAAGPFAPGAGFSSPVEVVPRQPDPSMYRDPDDRLPPDHPLATVRERPSEQAMAITPPTTPGPVVAPSRSVPPVPEASGWGPTHAPTESTGPAAAEAAGGPAPHHHAPHHHAPTPVPPSSTAHAASATAADAEQAFFAAPNATPCGRCGTPVDPTRAIYGRGGALICDGCAANEDIEESSTAIGSSLAGLGPLGWGAVSLLCNIMLIPSILAWVSGIRDLQATRGNSSEQASTIRMKAIFGIVLGSIHPLAVVGLLLIALASAALTPSYDPYEYDPYDPGYGSSYGNSYGNSYEYQPSDRWGAYEDPIAPGGFEPGVGDSEINAQEMDQLLRILEEMERMEQQDPYPPAVTP